MDDSAITCEEIFEEETKTVTTNFNEKMQCAKQEKFFMLLVFY